MRKLAVPAVVFAMVLLTYFVLSEAPWEVQMLSVTVLAVGHLNPAIWSAHVHRHRARLLVCVAFAAASILLWDGRAHYVVQKVEPFSILGNDAWVYVVAGTALSLWTFAVAWVASAPGKPVPSNAGRE